MAERAGSAGGTPLARAMAPAEWDQILELFHAARGKSCAERVMLLDNACGEDTLLRKAVEELLKEDEAADGFLSTPVYESITGKLRGSPAVPGQPFGRYMIGDLLGCGGMGEVWSARDTYLDRPVALKFLSSKALAVLDSEQITREAKAASALNHPNIVTIHEVVQSESTFAIVMELVEGSSLRQQTGKPLPADELLEISSQIARALAAAHGGNIVHGDIKPENILLRRDRYVKVLDFGLARRVTTETIAKAGSPGLGTLRYMSPEQARGESLTPASDVFSFGLVLYELATGRHAFPASSPVDTAQAILTKEAAPPSSVNSSLPARLDVLVPAMLAKEPAARPSAQEVARALEQSQVSRNTAPLSKKAQSVVWIGVSVLLGAALAWIAYLQMRKPENLGVVAERINSSGLPEWKIRPLTAEPGWESYPALSPDGKSVAFLWTGDFKQQRAIYLKRFDSDNPVLLFKPPSDYVIGALAWSPDGSKLAFKGWVNQSGAIWAIPSTGGRAVKLTNLRNSDLSSSIDWSPDGSRIVFSDYSPQSPALAIFSLDFGTSVKNKLTDPPSSDWGDWDPKYSADGQQIAFKRVTGFWADTLYVMPAAGGPPRAVTGGSKGIWGHAWSPAGDAFIVSTQGSGSIFGIWRYPLQPGSKPQRINEGGIDAITPTSARAMNRIAWIDQMDDTNIYRVPVKGNTAPQKLIASTRRDQSASYASDGRIAFASDRSGSGEIWIASPDGTHQVRATSFSGPLVGSPRWSPDSRYIAFQRFASGRNRIVVMKCQPGTAGCEQPVPLTAARESDPFSEDMPSWSTDGKVVYFSSNRTGNVEVWKESWPPGGTAVQVTQHRGASPITSSDGRWLYYVKGGPNSIWRLPITHENTAAPSTEERVLGPLDGLLTYSWTLTPGELLFFVIDPSGRSCDIRGYGLRSGKLRSVVNGLPFKTPSDLTASPDGRWLLYWQTDRSESNVMVADSNR